MARGTPKTYTLVIDAASEYGDNLIDIVGDFGKPARFCQIRTTENEDVVVRLNGDDDALFTLDGDSTQIFNRNDLVIETIEFANTDSGASGSRVEVIVGL